MTSNGSSIYSNAVAAQKMFYEQDAGNTFRIHILDSENYSIAYGLSVIRAARLCLSGASVDEIITAAQEWIDAAEAYFTVFSLNYLKKSGRAGKAAILAGEILGFRPIVSILHGKISQAKIVRGGKASISALTDIFQRRRTPDTDYAILMGNTASYAEQLARAAEAVAGKPPEGYYYAGPSIVSNSGPTILGICFMGK